MIRKTTSANRRAAGRITALLAIGLAGLTACSSTAVRGTAQKDPRVEKDAVVTGLLNPGNYSTTPLPPLGAAGDALKGGWAESRRMAEFVVLPFEVDPELTKNGGVQAGVVKDNSALAMALPASVAEGTKQNLVAGFTTISDTPSDLDPKTGKRTGPPLKSLQNSVLRFATPADATAAAADFAARSSSVKSIGDAEPKPTQPITIPRHPDTTAVTYTPLGDPIVIAYTAHGPYVLTQTTIANAGGQAAADLAATAIDKQIELIDRFEPTPVDKLAELPVDPDGLLARTLPADNPTVSMGVYGPHGGLAFSVDPPFFQKLWADTGVDQVSRGTSSVVRTKDAAAATQMVDELAKTVQTKGLQPETGVPGLPAARCFVEGENAGAIRQHYCVASADRYAFTVVAGKEEVARQQLTAQYLMLTAQ